MQHATLSEGISTAQVSQERRADADAIVQDQGNPVVPREACRHGVSRQTSASPLSALDDAVCDLGPGPRASGPPAWLPVAVLQPEDVGKGSAARRQRKVTGSKAPADAPPFIELVPERCRCIRSCVPLWSATNLFTDVTCYSGKMPLAVGHQRRGLSD